MPHAIRKLRREIECQKADSDPGLVRNPYLMGRHCRYHWFRDHRRARLVTIAFLHRRWDWLDYSAATDLSLDEFST